MALRQHMATITVDLEMGPDIKDVTAQLNRLVAAAGIRDGLHLTDLLVLLDGHDVLGLDPDVDRERRAAAAPAVGAMAGVHDHRGAV